MVRRIRAALALPAGAITLALVTGAVVMILSSPIVTGHLDPLLPLATYWAIVQGSLLSVNGLVDTMVAATPLILVGLSVALCFKAGLFNIGGQGQFLIGAVAAAGVAAALSTASPWIALPASLVVGVIAGALYGMIAGALKAFTGAHEVVTTIMLNYIAIQVISYLVTGPLREPGASFARSRDVGNAAVPLLFNQGTGHEAHLGILFPFIAVPIVWWLLYRTTLGFEIRTVGANPDVARYAGMRPRFLVMLTMAIGGGLGGLAGGIEILGVQHYMPAAYSTNVGFDAITVALLARANPVGVVFSGLLLGALRAGAPLMQIQAGVPVQMIDLLQGLILFFLAANVLVRKLFGTRATGGVDELQTVARSYGGQKNTSG